jgi:hypothetical protein
MSEDIQPGSYWNTVLLSELSTANICLVCVTPENKDSRWLNFEAGAIARSIDEAKVVPVLHQISVRELGYPLALFQCRQLDETGMLGIVRTLAQFDNRSAMQESVLLDAFNDTWPGLAAEVSDITRTTFTSLPCDVLTRCDQIAAVCYRKKPKGKLEFCLVTTSQGRRIFPKTYAKASEIVRNALLRCAHNDAGIRGRVCDDFATKFEYQKAGERGELTIHAGLVEWMSDVQPRKPSREPKWFGIDAAIDALSVNRNYKYANELQRVISQVVDHVDSAKPNGKHLPHLYSRDGQPVRRH